MTTILSLPTDLLKNSSFTFFDKKDAGSLAAASQTFNAIPAYHDLVTYKLLESAINGDQDLAKILITANPKAIVQKASMYDEKANMEWKSVTPLEFAAWAGDTHMVDMFIQNLPEGLKNSALEQLKNVRTHGTEHGEHLSTINLLIESYKTYGLGTERVIDEQWIKIVGGAQRKTPMNFLQYFCFPGSLKAFDSKPIRQYSLRYSSDCLDSNSKLGINFTLYRRVQKKWLWSSGTIMYTTTSQGAYAGRRICPEPPGGRGTIERDLEFVREFHKVRKKDLIKQIDLLERELTRSCCRWLTF